MFVFPINRHRERSSDYGGRGGYYDGPPSRGGRGSYSGGPSYRGNCLLLVTTRGGGCCLLL